MKRRQRENRAERQQLALRQVYAGVLRQQVDDQGMHHPGLPAGAESYHLSEPRGAQLPRVLPTGRSRHEGQGIRGAI